MKRRFAKFSWWIAGGYIFLILFSLLLIHIPPLPIPDCIARPAMWFIFLPRTVTWPWCDLVQDRLENALVDLQIALEMSEGQIGASNIVFFVVIQIAYVCWFWIVGVLVSRLASWFFSRGAKASRPDI